MKVLGFCKMVQHLLTYKFNHNGYTKIKKNIITPKNLQKKCEKSAFFVYVCDKEELDYGVPIEYVHSSLFEDFIHAYEQADSEILDTKRDELDELELKEYEVPKENSSSSLFVDCFDEFQQEIKTLDTKKEEVKLKEYEVPDEFLTSTLFGDFFDELEQDIEIEDTKKEELEWKKYEVPKEYLSSSWFKDFFREQDITILNTGEELELSVTSCSVHDFEYLLAMTKLQIYP
ncbi:hypothetical protein A4A49_32589 [Nicotiana attenuata]|uniref:Uncharacterized protein n=1 Tax=Nicotiana attenuata TaxID=49451 RepID=A0A1J6JBZ3_NICAT|nr:hypothetical protein A4A49_32589 [Nicotiana attenuata]